MGVVEQKFLCFNPKAFMLDTIFDKVN